MPTPPPSAEIRPLKAIVLAAGRGERMRPLTDATPKPLLKVHGKPLIEWHLEALARDGVREVVVNGAWLEQQLVDTLGNGSRFDLTIRYSLEGRDHGGALETAGGIAKALPLLRDATRPTADDAFWVVSGDIYVPGFRFDARLAQEFAAGDRLAHLWLVDNPSYHPTGDFALDAQGLALSGEAAAHGKRWTYANIALCRADLLASVIPGSRAALGPLLHAAMRDRRISAEVWRGAWENLGTPAQLDALNAAA
jgi:MurNAc alpha-1-phosphate uridylyltransferase